ncbi:MAG TPA: hypothetical protein VM100_01180 [Longimicrobiales bacterium]|nr:hypothetical protein [Longimicrobiales bacterium]
MLKIQPFFSNRTGMQLTPLLVVMLTGCAGNSVTKDLNRLRSATSSFQNLNNAVAAGYPRDVPDCFIHEHHGAMGYHHVNRGYVDGKVEVEHPEILLYEKRANGEYVLNGVEYIVPYRAWSKDSVPPVVMGQKMLHENKLNIWSLHVWAWNKNPNGLFADFHPSVQCPSDNQKVFTPAH